MPHIHWVDEDKPITVDQPQTLRRWPGFKAVLARIVELEREKYAKAATHGPLYCSCDSCLLAGYSHGTGEGVKDEYARIK